MKSSSGFKLTKDKPFYFNKVIYLGRCTTNGDIFAAYKGEDVSIYKGHLNSGKY